MTNFIQRLREDRPLLGVLVTVESPEIAEALALAGVDWLFLDAEHSPVLSPGAIQRIIQAVAGRAYVLVRVPANEESFIKNALDAGADGVIIPHVRSASDARRAVAAAKYPPTGERSVGIARAHGYGLNFSEYLMKANEFVAVILQIEDGEAVDSVQEIVEIAGADAIFIGPYDLSGSMGRLGQVNDVEVRGAIDRVIAAGNQAGMPIGIFAPESDAARTQVQRGMRLIAVGTDLGHLMSSARRAVEESLQPHQ